MKNCGIRKNNRGDSLILVIGCIALLSIVGMVLLVKTLDNRSMKLAEEQAQASFAGAESGSAEMVTAIETAAFDVIQVAFGDMMLEYSLLANDDDRNQRYMQFFEKKLDNLLTAKTLQEQLGDALGGSGITDLKVERGDVVIDSDAAGGYTNTVRVKDVEFTYKTNGSTTKITTDICVKALVPNVSAGFNSGISCDFLDFALVADGNVSSINKAEDMIIQGNMYVGGDFVVSNAVAKINKAKKLLIKKEIELQNAGQIWVKADGVTFSKGEGVWAGGISVSDSTFNTDGVNVYVKDDLAVDGISTNVVMKGSSSEYVGYSGGTGSANHERSSAININESVNLTLDLSELGELYINGNSYICENNNNWGAGFVEGTTNMAAAEGILQGESVAYKDMQALYLVPGSCLPNHSHNPIIGTFDEESIGTIDLDYKFKRAGDAVYQHLNLANYVDAANPCVTRTARLDGGATVATYVYLNFKSEAAAAQYVEDYLNTFLGESVKAQIKNLGSSSKILLPTNTFTLSNALSYDGTNMTMLPAADATGQNMLNIAGALAEQRSSGLFSALRVEGGTPTTAGYRMVKDGILNMEAFNALAPNEEKQIDITASNGEKYRFIVYNGNLKISDNSRFNGVQGAILLVNGNLEIDVTPLTINGLVLVTGEITQGAGALFTAKEEAVETLIADEEVAKYFRVFGADSGHGYLSTEAVKISFENWKKN